MEQKIFTPEEAERLIPRLEMIVDNMIRARKNALEVNEGILRMQDQIEYGGPRAVEPVLLVNAHTELDFLLQIVQEGIDAIEELGGQTRDVNFGLVDFPAVVEGRSVLLCWKLGEKSIRYYHGCQEGFSGRKRLGRPAEH
jgi:hypothetical protein